MSHIASMQPKAGEPVFVDIDALTEAVKKLGLVITKKRTYRWWGQSVGDYPLPVGMTAADLGNNATYVISLPEEEGKRHSLGGRGPFEIGVIADKANPGCFTICYDFFNGGYGLDKYVGEPVYNDKGELEVLAPRLLQHYAMACDAKAAAEAGDNITFMTTREAHVKFPEQFANTGDDQSYVSVVDTGARVGDNSLAFDKVAQY